MRSQRFLFVLISTLLLTCFATAQVTWERYPGNPIIPSSYPNYYYTLEPSIIFDTLTNTYKCWFTSITYGVGYRISYAYSSDGVSWTKYSGNPVLSPTPGTFDESEVKGCSVIKDNVGYKMYYTAYKSTTAKYSIGLALSSDGIQWQKYSNNPILEGSSSLSAWDSTVYFPNVYFDGTKYWMWYTGRDAHKSQTGLAVSSDGINWEKSISNPVIPVGPSGAWDEIDAGCGGVCKRDSIWYMMYLGRGYSGYSKTSIGFAVSVDGINWDKNISNPVMVPTSGASWEDSHLGRGTILFKDNKFHFWYSAQGGVWQIGYATSNYEPPIITPGNYALQFDGNDDFIDINSAPSLDMSDAITMEAWVFHSGSGSGAHYDVIMARGGEYEVAVHKNREVNFAINTSSPGWVWINSGYFLPDNIWTHIAVTYSATSQQMMLYINGKLKFTGSANGNITQQHSSEHLSIGNWNVLTVGFKGIIDEVRLWNSALSDSTIQQWMNKPLTSSHPEYSSLRGYWKFDEGTGTITADASGNGNTGTLVNGPIWVSLDTQADLVAYYPFNGNANDASGNNNHGLIVGNVNLTKNRFGYTNSAYDFTNTASYINLPNNLIARYDKLSLSLWFKTDNKGVVFGSQSSAYPSWPLHAYVPNIYIGSDSRLRAEFWMGDDTPITSSDTVNDNKWHFVVLSANVDSQSLYLDGNLIGTLAGKIDNSEAPYNQIGIGNTGVRNNLGWPGGNDEWYQYFGKIDDIRIHNYALIQSEIDSFFREGGWDENFVVGPELVYPPDNTSINSTFVPFFWRKGAADVIGYWFELASDSNFYFKSIDTSLTDTMKTMTLLSVNTKYWWRVRSKTLSGWSGFSEKRKFYITLTGIIENDNLPAEFKLEQNYPNPFNPTTMIKYDLPVESNVKLKIFDVLGREIATLIDGIQTPGFKYVNWNSKDGLGRSVASGIYFYKLEAIKLSDHQNVFTQMHKMVLMR